MIEPQRSFTRRKGMDQDGHDLTVYYDGACPLCTLEIDHYRKQRGAERIRFVDAASPDAELGADLNRSAALARFHVRSQKGELMSGARGFREIWTLLPRWRFAARLARMPGATPLLELAYRAFLPLRPTLARMLAHLTNKRSQKQS